VEQRVSVVTLGVADLDRARAFYEALGWASPSTPEEGVVFFPCGGMVLALWSRASLAEDSTVTDPGGWGGVTLAHNVGSPEAVDAVLEEARAAGATIGRPGAATFWGGYSGCSSTRTAIRGRSPTTRSGSWVPTAPSRSDVGPAHPAIRGTVSPNALRLCAEEGACSGEALWSLHRRRSRGTIVHRSERGGSVMDSGKISYAGVGAAVAGVIGMAGVYSTWWETDTASYNGTADISGSLGFAMALGLFAAGGAYVLISDPKIRRATGALATLFAVVLALSCVWAVIRTDDVAPGATVSMGLFVSALGGVLGIAAGFLVMRDNQVVDDGIAGETPSAMPADSSTGMSSGEAGA
jgi:catechol 2,3-dioxygenase-like lactoylglutathione lyase family enzyme